MAKRKSGSKTTTQRIQKLKGKIDAGESLPQDEIRIANLRAKRSRARSNGPSATAASSTLASSGSTSKWHAAPPQRPPVAPPQRAPVAPPQRPALRSLRCPTWFRPPANAGPPAKAAASSTAASSGNAPPLPVQPLEHPPLAPPWRQPVPKRPDGWHTSTQPKWIISL